MTRYNFKGFYGSYGYILEHDDGTAFVEIIWNTCIPTAPHRKTYKNLHGAKIALSKLLDVWTIQKVRGDI